VTLVDANVLLDVVTDDPVAWSLARLAEAALTAPPSLGVGAALRL